MKNKFYKIILFIFFLSGFNAFASDPFNFDVTEVEILEEGNKFIGLKKGTVTSDNGIVIDANRFEYDKITIRVAKRCNLFENG